MRYVDMFADTKVWQSREGPIEITDMTVSHLKNAVRMLQDNVEDLRTAWGLEMFVSGPEPSGEMAQDAVDSAMAEDARQSDSAWLRSTPLYKALRREQKRRTSTPPDEVPAEDLDAKYGSMADHAAH